MFIIIFRYLIILEWILFYKETEMKANNKTEKNDKKKTSPVSTISLVQARHKRMDTSSGMKKMLKHLRSRPNMPAGNHMASRWKNDSNSMRSPSSNAIIIFVERSDLQKTVPDPQVLR